MPRTVSDEMRTRTAEIGARIKQARRIRGVGMEALAERLGVSFQQVQKYENGKNRVAACTLVEIAQALDVDIAFFLPADIAPPSRAELAQARVDLAAALTDLDRSIDELDRHRASLRTHLDRLNEARRGDAADPVRRVA